MYSVNCYFKNLTFFLAQNAKDQPDHLHQQQHVHWIVRIKAFVSNDLIYAYSKRSSTYFHYIITAGNEVGAMLCFHRRVWFCSQEGVVSASVHAGIPHPPEQTTPGVDPPWRRACWEIRSTRGRYASYWNAILCCKIHFQLWFQVFVWQ